MIWPGLLLVCMGLSWFDTNLQGLSWFVVGNVGFDRFGETKIFDFGLALELPSSSSQDDSSSASSSSQEETFELGNAGTARYLAPEVIKKQPYNAKADIFSFSVVLWEMLALSKPFADLDADEVKEFVSQLGHRPTIPRTWPSVLRNLLRRGWHKSMHQRPSAQEYQTKLAEIMAMTPCKSGALFSRTCQLK